MAMTAEDLLKLPTGMGECYELAAGELVTALAPGMQHGFIAANIGSVLLGYVRSRYLGDVLGTGTGFILSRHPDTVRAPDAAFVVAARVPASGLPEGFFPAAPDLAVEVISPSEAAAEVQSKVSEYFAAGSRLVWLVYPNTRQVVVFRSARESLTLNSDDTLDAGDLLPGFACRVAELFE